MVPMSAAWVPECAEDELLVAIVALKRAFQARATGSDPGAFPVLHHLAVGGPCRSGTLADALSLDASTVSRHVRSLVGEGLVEGSRDPEDGRATVLTITPAGRAWLTQRLHAHRATLQDATSDFTAQERSELVRLLHKLADALGQHDERKESA
jgi:DNA-binding MarR family transcriptional regulator